MAIEIQSARQALNAYRAPNPSHRAPTSTEDDITDLLADLFHLCDTNGIDVDTVIERATEHYREEKEQVGNTTPHPLGAYVVDREHGYKGRITAVHFYCELPESEAWVATQYPPITDEAKESIYLWYSILLDGSGSALRPMYALDKSDPFPITNGYASVYWPDEANG